MVRLELVKLISVFVEGQDTTRETVSRGVVTANNEQ